MLTGAIFGAIIVLLLFAVAFLLGANRVIKAHADSVEKHANEVAAQADAADENLRKLGAEVQKLQQPHIINMTEQQATDIATIILHRMKQIVVAEQNGTLNKLD